MREVNHWKKAILFGQRLEEMIDKAINGGLYKTREEIAKEIGVDRSQIKKWESGVVPRADSLEKICKVLNCSSDYLLGLSDSNYFDIDYKAAVRFTGLNENVIDLLNKEDENHLIITLLAAFCDDEKHVSVLKYLNNALMLAKMATSQTIYDNNFVFDSEKNRVVLSTLESIDYYVDAVSTEIQAMLAKYFGRVMKSSMKENDKYQSYRDAINRITPPENIDED